MRLISANLSGFRRFADADINLDADLVAVVGPNEAGKTSLLDALAAVEEDGPIDPKDLTRGLPDRPSGSDGVITLRFLLTADDHDILDDFPLVGSPRWFLITKQANGKLYLSVEPDVKKDLTIRTFVMEAIDRAVNYTHVRATLSNYYPPFDESSDGPKYPLIMMLDRLSTRLDSTDETLPKHTLDLLSNVASAVDHAAADTNDSKQRSYLKNVLGELHRLKAFETPPHPKKDFLADLYDRHPRLFLFREEERQLGSEYSTNVLSAAGPVGPPALANLFELAEVDSSELYAALEEGDHGRRAALEEAANDTLQAKFEEAWSQSSVFPRLQFEQELIRILVPARDTYSPIAERSDGLRSFVALCAFTTLKSEDTDPILLIDEAESHLHYDAQGDLVGVFERQDVASQIIYTTHSAGCLPNDLGAGVRAIKPNVKSKKLDTGRSAISNSFWEEGAGFSPLMMAMGASVMAFVPTRRAVIAEGASETIMLPTLLREAGMLGRLPFQVAPGLASVPNDKLQQLDLEAPKVAYLVDGDESGAEHARRLQAAGVSDELIHQLPEDAVLEDFISTELYKRAVNEELFRSHGDRVKVSSGDLPDLNRPSGVQDVCDRYDVGSPSKVRVARQVVHLAGSQKNVIRNALREALRELLAELFDSFGQDLEAFREAHPWRVK